MRDFKNALIACACVAFLAIVGIAIWTVRQYLPIVGIVLLVVLVVAMLLALVYVLEHLHRRFTRYEHIQISQYGSVLHRRNQIVQIAPYHPGQSARASQPEEDYIEADIEDEEADEMPALLPRIPSFAEMLDAGMIQAAISRGQLVIGYYAETHQPRYGSWLDLYSAGNGGVSGSGKSTTTRFLLFQAVLASARLIMIDPHIGDPDESLSYQFSLLPAGIHQMQPCDGRAVNVNKRVDWLDRELARRERNGIKTPGLVLVIDEFNSVMRHADKETRARLTKLLLDIEQEGRKFGIFALLLGQRWSAQDLGGADIRTSLASKIAHRFSDEDQAKRFIGSKYGKMLLELETGHWLFYDTKGKTAEMVTPETVAQDGAIIAGLIGHTGPENTLKPRERTALLPEKTSTSKVIALARNYDETTEEEAEITDENTGLADVAVVVADLLAAGQQKNEVMRQVWGVNPGGSEAYKKAIIEYQEVLKYIRSQLGA